MPLFTSMPVSRTRMRRNGSTTARTKRSRTTTLATACGRATSTSSSGILAMAATCTTSGCKCRKPACFRCPSPAMGTKSTQRVSLSRRWVLGGYLPDDREAFDEEVDGLEEFEQVTVFEQDLAVHDGALGVKAVVEFAPALVVHVENVGRVERVIWA